MLEETWLSTCVSDCNAQLSVAVAVPNAASIAVPVGLHPMLLLFPTEPVAVMTGFTRSTFQKMVRVSVEEFPQESVAVHVRVCD